VARKVWETLFEISKGERNHALVNGALNAIELLAIVDNVVAH
jgi:hypothetical protein